MTDVPIHEKPSPHIPLPGDEDGWPVDRWANAARQLLAHQLVRLVAADSADALSDPNAIDGLMDELRTFVPLKVQIESMLPPADDLEAVHASLTDYARRIMLAANQAIHNNISAIKEESRLQGEPLRKLRTQTEPHRRMLIDWQLRRIQETRQHFREAVEKVDGANREILDELMKSGFPPAQE